jgi:hypothetical protein
MLSQKRMGVLYPANTDIANFDLGTDVEEYTYDGREVFRGNLDPEFSDAEYQVYWLYDESQRVGLAEHTADSHKCYWFYSNVFATLLQEPEWESRDRSVWSMMSEAAYEDCMRYGWTSIEDLQKRTSLAILRPSDLVKYTHPDSLCIVCNTNDGLPGCTHEKRTPRFDVFFTLFVDDDGVLYAPPSDTQAFATLRRPDGAGAGAGTGAGAGAGAGAEAVGVGADSDSSTSSSSSSSSANAALAPPTTGAGASSASSTSSLNISRAV